MSLGLFIVCILILILIVLLYFFWIYLQAFVIVQFLKNPISKNFC